MATPGAAADSDVEVVDEQDMLKKRRLRHMTPFERMRDAVLKKNFTATQLGSLFRVIDEDGNQVINMKEFQVGVRELNVNVTSTDVRDMFLSFDADKSGTIDFNEFYTAITLTTPAKRIAVVEQAFDKLDRTGKGTVTIETIRTTYNTEDNPELGKLEWKGATGLAALLNYFTGPNGISKVVTRLEFKEYYAGISAAMIDDEHFTQMMHHSWKLKPGKKYV